MRYELSPRDGIDGSAAATSADALFELGLKFCAGREVGLDLVEAHKWFSLAAMRGNEAARGYRLEIGRELSRTDIVRAQKLAREWLAIN